MYHLAGLPTFANFSNLSAFFRDAEDAVKDLDGRDLNGERMRVELARSRKELNSTNYLHFLNFLL